MRGFGFAFEPLRPPDPVTSAPADERTGACRRASRQMNSEIPARMIAAPAAIRIAFVPDRPLLAFDEVEVPETAGVVDVGVVIGDAGTPGENGLVVPGLTLIGAVEVEVEVDVAASAVPQGASTDTATVASSVSDAARKERIDRTPRATLTPARG